MPSTVIKQIIQPVIRGSDFESMPEWAWIEYKQSQITLFKLLLERTKLQQNISNLENMELKDQCPRSMQVKITVNVKEDQQQALSMSIEEAKKTFEKTVLKALIQARKKELSGINSQITKHSDTFTTYMKEQYQKLKTNNIPLVETDDEDINQSVEMATSAYNLRHQHVLRYIETQHFFNEQAKLQKKQANDAAKEQNKMDHEMRNKEVVELENRINKLEKVIRRNNTNSTTKPTKKKNKQKGKPSPPFQKHQGRKPKIKQQTDKVQEGRRNQDQGQGNPRHRPRYTNTTNRSKSMPPNSRRKQN